MKKATFLFVIGLIIVGGRSRLVDAEEYQFTGYTIGLEEKVIDGEQTIVVTKGGIGAFETRVGIEGYHLYYNGVEVKGDTIVVYGYSMGGYAMREYSAFIVVLNQSGDIVYGDRDVFDYGAQEDVKNVYFLEDNVLVEILKTEDNGYHVTTLGYVYLLFDETGNLIAEHKIADTVKETVVDGNMLLGRTSRGDDYDFGIKASGNILFKGDEIGVEDEAIYYEEVCLSSLNTLYVNEEKVDNYYCIDVVGLHYVEVDGRNLSFTMEAIVEGVEENQIYYEPVQISVSGGYVTLNGDSYTDYEEVLDIGTYVLLIEGENEYKKEIHFEIGSVIEGITNNTVYEEDVTISFTGKGYLNNQYISSPFTVENEGEYIFKIKGEDGYLESYYFEIVAPVKETTFIDFVQKIDVFILGAVLIVGIVVVKKKR